MRQDLEVLSRDFYNQPTLILAEKLLGHILVHETEEGTTSGRIVETEAYLGENDQAAHSYKKRCTKRTKIMFQAPGHVYIYQMHTHHLINVVAGEIDNPQAILIRADEPIEGIELIEKRRPVKKYTNLTSGPGRLTKETKIMFQAPGHVYIYQMHTHHLINVVAGEIGNPQAILIRAVEPIEGIELMEQRRPVKKFTNLTSGPGKLTKAFGITKEDYGRTFFEAPLYIAKGHPPSNVATGTRIGIDNAGEAKDYPYRFWVEGNKFVSR